MARTIRERRRQFARHILDPESAHVLVRIQQAIEKQQRFISSVCHDERIKRGGKRDREREREGTKTKKFKNTRRFGFANNHYWVTFKAADNISLLHTGLRIIAIIRWIRHTMAKRRCAALSTECWNDKGQLMKCAARENATQKISDAVPAGTAQNSEAMASPPLGGAGRSCQSNPFVTTHRLPVQQWTHRPVLCFSRISAANGKRTVLF